MYIFKNDPTIQKRVRIKQALFPIIVIALFLIFIQGHKVYMPFFLFCLMVGVFRVIFFPSMTEFQYKRLLSKKLASIASDSDEQTLRLDENGIVN